MYNKITVTSLVSLLFLSIMFAPSVFASESDVSRITIDVPTSCSMTAVGTGSHIAEISNGQTANNIGTTTLKVLCNDNSGYAIYAIGYTDNTYGKTVLTDSALGSLVDIATSATITTGTSSWAMKLASVQGTYAPIIAGSSADSLKQSGDPDFSAYQAIPQSYTKVAYFDGTTDGGDGATGSNLTTTYRVYISTAQPAGTYIGQVKYTLVHPDSSGTPTIYTVSFDANSGNETVTGLPAQQDGLGIGSYVFTLPSATPTREGYDFLGWSIDPAAITPDYLAGETFTATTANSTLYAVWAMPYIWSATLDSCGWTFLDDRDGTEREYTTGLVDGQCWMTTNLMLGGTVDTMLTSDTSNVSSSGYTLPGYSIMRGGGGDLPEEGSSVVYTYNTTCSSSWAGGCYNYYNHNVACAGSSGCQYDICPANWRLPTYAELSSIASLYTTPAAITASPFLGVYGGSGATGTIGSNGVIGEYWASTSYDTRNSYMLAFGTFNNNDFVSTNYEFNTYLLSVRCVLQGGN